MDIYSLLEQVGLKKNEITVYMFLLEHGFSTPPDVAKGTSIARSNTYPLLKSLKHKQLVTEQKHGKRKAYMAKDPEALIQQADQRKQAIEKALPTLRGVYAKHQNKPTIRFFDGFDEVKEVYYMMLNTKEVFGIGSTNELSRIGQQFYTRWLKEVKKRNIVFHDILSHESGDTAAPAMKEVLRGLYDYQLLPQRYEDFPTDILIWEDNVALLTLEEPIFGTVITNPTLAQTFQLLFRVLWDYNKRT